MHLLPIVTLTVLLCAYYGDAGTVFTGDATYTTPGMGACEIDSKEGQMVASINTEQFGTPKRGRDSVWCKKCIKVTATKFKKSVVVQVTDRAAGKKGHIVLSTAAFQKLASTDEGRIDVKYEEAPCPKSG